MEEKLTYFYERGKREILEDIAAGIQPDSVASFSELHDRVDANEYCGFAEEGVLCGCPPDEPCSGLCGGRITIAGVNEVQCALDAWLRKGRP
ncbi:MAG TPA: hypothetical protein VKV05_09950 [Terriglobales bacterium]|jgi:hypothetical protein|nr:hypothetical protein [Terriglobales bacterium]